MKCIFPPARRLPAVLFAAAAALVLPAVAASAALRLKTPQLPPGTQATGSTASSLRTAEPPDALKTFVFFRDKGFDSPESQQRAIENLAQTYDAHAVQRRALRRTRPGLFDATDLPVHEAYVNAVTASGAIVHVRSRWLNAISVTAESTQMEQIARMPFVSRMQPVARGRKIRLQDPVRHDSPPGEGGVAAFYGLAQDQLEQMNLIAVHGQGFTGTGMRIGILDTGFLRSHVAFNHPQHPLNVVAEYDFINNDANTAPQPGDHPDQHFHGTFILGELAAYRPDEYVGAAYDAAYILCKTEDITNEYPAEEDYYVAGLEFIEQHGGDVATSSLGYIDWYTQEDLDGQTAVTTIGVNMATANGLICCTAAGNSGHDLDPSTSHLIAPADALEVFTCGATEPTGEYASFTSDGPTADGRVKPEVHARGRIVYSVWPYDNTSYAEANGTSTSTPLVAGMLACLAQARPAWTISRLRTQVFYTASYFAANGTYDPYFIDGYGFVNAADALALEDCNQNAVSDAQDIANGTSSDINGNGVPDECDGLGDMDCDGSLNAFDIQGFILALSDPAEYQSNYPACDLLHADTSGDGSVNGFDIQGFVELLSP